MASCRSSGRTQLGTKEQLAGWAKSPSERLFLSEEMLPLLLLLLPFGIKHDGSKKKCAILLDVRMIPGTKVFTINTTVVQ